eukprot:scaffold5835_cov58-Phaeocystis_antarctica.AAC.1
MTCPSPPERGAARIYLRQVGSRTGVVAELPSAWSELVRLAETKMGFVPRPLRFFLATGDELGEDGLDLVRANEAIYVSGGGEDWAPLGESTTTDPTSDSTSDALAMLHSEPEQRHRTVIALANLSHHLQRERGTSCTWLASGRSIPNFKTLLVDIRPEVDAALREVVRPDAQQWFDQIVALIATERHAVDAAPDSIAGRTGGRLLRDTAGLLRRDLLGAGGGGGGGREREQLHRRDGHLRAVQPPQGIAGDGARIPLGCPRAARYAARLHPEARLRRPGRVRPPGQDPRELAAGRRARRAARDRVSRLPRRRGAAVRAGGARERLRPARRALLPLGGAVLGPLLDARGQAAAARGAPRRGRAEGRPQPRAQPRAGDG